MRAIATARALAARAQQPVLPEPQAHLAALARGLRELGWTDEETAKVLYLPVWTEGPAVGINLSAAKAIGRTVPPTPLLLADEIAE